MRAKEPNKKAGKPKATLLGLAFDAEENDQKRITRGKNFVLAGGSEETHSQMQETAIKLNEKLDRRGKRLEEVSPNELRDMLEDTCR